MRHLAAYLLLITGGNAAPTAEDVSAVLAQAGIESDSERLTALLKELEGKDLNECLTLGRAKLMVGGGPSSSAPAASASSGSAGNRV